MLTFSLSLSLSHARSLYYFSVVYVALLILSCHQGWSCSLSLTLSLSLSLSLSHARSLSLSLLLLCCLRRPINIVPTEGAIYLSLGKCSLASNQNRCPTYTDNVSLPSLPKHQFSQSDVKHARPTVHSASLMCDFSVN